MSIRDIRRWLVVARKHQLLRREAEDIQSPSPGGVDSGCPDANKKVANSFEVDTCYGGMLGHFEMEPEAIVEGSATVD